MPVTIDSLTAAELYALGGAAGVTYLFGLPEREQLALIDPDCAEKAKDGLIKKGVLTSDGKMTDAAFQLAEALKYYQKSKEYARFNNVMCAFLPDDDEHIIAITEIKAETAYTVDFLEKRQVYLTIISAVSFLLREPREKDQTFSLKRMSLKERAEVSEMDLTNEEVLAVETFKRAPEHQPTHDGLHEAAFYFTKGEDFVAVDPLHDRYEWISLHMLNKRLFDTLKIVYGKRRALND
ncbi:DUF5081 family protein [Bacillus sp. CLL-7-23]|uniref:DUF5081 family protein n=1 Tax=Bacillus changyiensis TaxID=3004103 RepID=A0ABT4X734_9BACI|nr:DUF5081 family protein [Bacillus changyiensis]MDA7028106.1 DUF5081 family protein [Bacillus changyiensis]